MVCKGHQGKFDIFHFLQHTNRHHRGKQTQRYYIGLEELLGGYQYLQDIIQLYVYITYLRHNGKESDVFLMYILNYFNPH